MVSKFTSVLPSGCVCVASAGNPTRRNALSTSPGVTCGGWYAGGVPPKHSFLMVVHRPLESWPQSCHRRIAGVGHVSANAQSTSLGLAFGAFEQIEAQR